MKLRNSSITLSTPPARIIYHAVLQVHLAERPHHYTEGRRSVLALTLAPFSSFTHAPTPKNVIPSTQRSLILTLALLRIDRSASYRHLLFCLAPEALVDQLVPALSTLLYSLQTISDERWQALPS